MRRLVMGAHNPPHPADIVKRQSLEPPGLSVSWAAEGLGATRWALSGLVNERTGISVDRAIPLSKAFSSTPKTWRGDTDGLRSREGPRPRRADGIVRPQGITRTEVARILGLSQPDVSRLLRGDFREYSLERLSRLLTALGRKIDIVIRQPRCAADGKLRIAASEVG